MSEDRPPAAAFPSDPAKFHAIISGQLAPIAALQAEVRQLRLQRDAWQTLAAVRHGWAPLQAPSDRFSVLCLAFAPFLPLEQQAAIVAGLLEGERDA